MYIFVSLNSTNIGLPDILDIPDVPDYSFRQKLPILSKIIFLHRYLHVHGHLHEIFAYKMCAKLQNKHDIHNVFAKKNKKIHNLSHIHSKKRKPCIHTRLPKNTS